MKRFLSALFFAMVLILPAGCGADQSNLQSADDSMTEDTDSESDESVINDAADNADDAEEIALIYAHIGESVIEITPAENSSAEAFVELLKQNDVTVEMHDYGGFEKVGSLGTSLPANDESITTEAGDVILYQGNSITIYYDKNTWSFTRLGKVQGLSQPELKEILGDGDVSVTFSLGR